MNLSQLSRPKRRALERRQHKYVSQFPAALEQIPPELWPAGMQDSARIAVWRSNKYLVQVFIEPSQIMRLSVARAQLSGDRWKDGIAWDELQKIKADVGFADKFAVEIFPAETEIVNVANMRHLWVLPEPPAFAWRKA